MKARKVWQRKAGRKREVEKILNLFDCLVEGKQIRIGDGGKKIIGWMQKIYGACTLTAIVVDENHEKFYYSQVSVKENALQLHM